MKRKFTVLIVLAISLTFSLPSGKAINFIDVPETLGQRAAIEYLSDQNIFRGQGDSNRFDPDGILNRAEWAVLLVRYKKGNPSPDDYGFCFSDITVQWYAPDVCFAKELDLVRGYQAGPEAGSYIATNPLRLAEILVTLQRMFDWPVDEGEFWFSGTMAYAVAANLITSDQSFDDLVTRAEAAELLFRAHALEEFNIIQYDPLVGELLRPRTADPSTPEQPQPEVPQQPIQVTLLPFADQPAETSVARGATYVPVVRFLIESEEKVTLEELSIRRVSVGRTEDIAYARLELNGKIVKEGSFSGERNSVVWRNLSIPLEPSNAILGEMNIDFVEDAQDNLFYQFKVEKEGLKFSQPVTVQGEDVQGEHFRTALIPAERVTISNPSRGINLPFTDADRETIGRFEITAGEHDLLIKRIRLEDAEDVNNRNYSNFRLTAGSQQIGFLEEISRNVLDFSVDNYLLEAGKSRTLTVRADISDADKDDNIRLYMEDPEHLHAFDFEFGFGVRVVNNFGREAAWCVGSETVECPVEGFRKRCSKNDREAGIKGCEEEEEEEEVLEECDDRLAPVCGRVGGTPPQTFVNRCLAEHSGATGITPGPCENSGISCTALFEPVCGTIPVACEEPPCDLAPFTFSNRCHAELAEATNITDGVCP